MREPGLDPVAWHRVREIWRSHLVYRRGGIDGRPDLIIDAGAGLRVADGLFGGRPFEAAIVLGLAFPPFA